MTITTVCIIVASIIGVYCAEGADSIGECEQFSDALICHVEAYELDLWASTYNPEMGGINCNDNCDHTATRPVTPDMYDWAAACPAGWTRFGATTIVRTPYRDVYCVDRGGAIEPAWRLTWTPAGGYVWLWVIVIDFMMADLEYWNYQVIPAGSWSLGWGLPPGDE